jgi:hypothetical protein
MNAVHIKSATQKCVQKVPGFHYIAYAQLNGKFGNYE